MQFGKLHGIALTILGILLLVFQATLYMSPTKVASGPEPRTVEQRTNPVPGIVGIVSLFSGIAVFLTAQRRDEPQPKHALKKPRPS
jgi:hypothetical protein